MERSWRPLVVRVKRDFIESFVQNNSEILIPTYLFRRGLGSSDLITLY